MFDQKPCPSKYRYRHIIWQVWMPHCRVMTDNRTVSNGGGPFAYFTEFPSIPVNWVCFYQITYPWQHGYRHHICQVWMPHCRVMSDNRNFSNGGSSFAYFTKFPASHWMGYALITFLTPENMGIDTLFVMFGRSNAELWWKIGFSVMAAAHLHMNAFLESFHQIYRGRLLIWSNRNA